ncbi:uncharacterized protein LOC119339263 [Triticum dicoccoides]|uniref:uncharacterized protein LOC119339263 n=1 Tax=Triticum dicoccoides TaxID=85692 RepID=UPI001891F24B|nr:uncharacterized protein LOC119339263 [Triticum dicoccoides]
MAAHEGCQVGPEIAHLVWLCPLLLPDLAHRLQDAVLPALFGSFDNFLRALRCGSYLISSDLGKVIKPNVVFPWECGLSDYDIVKCDVQASALQAIMFLGEEKVATKLEYLKKTFRWADAELSINGRAWRVAVRSCGYGVGEGGGTSFCALIRPPRLSLDAAAASHPLLPASSPPHRPPHPRLASPEGRCRHPRRRGRGGSGACCGGADPGTTPGVVRRPRPRRPPPRSCISRRAPSSSAASGKGRKGSRLWRSGSRDGPGGYETSSTSSSAASVVAAVARAPPADFRVIRQEWAAVRVQAAFCALLARRSLKALRRIERLQALVRGRLVRRHLAVTLSRMEALLRVQERTMERRARCSADAQSQDLNGFADPLREPELYMKFHIHESPLIWLRSTTDDTSLLPCSCEGNRRPAPPTVISSLCLHLFMRVVFLPRHHGSAGMCLVVEEGVALSFVLLISTTPSNALRNVSWNFSIQLLSTLESTYLCLRLQSIIFHNLSKWGQYDID